MSAAKIYAMTAELTSRPNGTPFQSSTPVDRPPTDPPGWRRHVTAANGGFAALLTGTALLYLIGLSTNGWANSFYSAAIQAGSKSWKAWFFGASDAAGSITVDKPPMSLWIPSIAVRIFGLNPWAILVPEALMGVASVAMIYLIVRKRFSANAGLIAGAALALTPVATMMFRFNNPDALLILLTVAAVWTTIKALEDNRIRWMLLTGMFIGFAFLTKQLQAFLILPPLAIVFFAFGPGTWKRRTGHLLAGLGSLIVSAGWWILAVTVWPASSRPYIGGSQHNSILELTMGYNGLGRITGNETGSVTPGRGMEIPAGMAGMEGRPGGGGPGGGMWGQTGFLRMFQPEQGGQIAWLIPAALILSVAVMAARWKVPRTDIKRAVVVLGFLWLLTTLAVFSFMSGIFHAYYTVALAPPIGLLVGIGTTELWRERQKLWARITLAGSSVATGALAFYLLNRSADFLPWLRWVVLIGSIAAALVLLVAHSGRPSLKRAALAAALAAIIFGLAAPAAYSIDTAATAKQGSIPSAGPSVRGGFGPVGHGGPGGAWRHRGGPGGQFGPGGVPGGQRGPGGLPGGQQGPGGTTVGGPGGRGGMGNFLDGSKPSAALTALLNTGAAKYTWVAAAIGSNEASGYQLATQHSVMPIGGFNGSDPSPTLAQFQKLVSEHKIHYFIAGGGMGFGGSGSSTEISSWVKAHFRSITVDGTMLYDLTQQTS